MTNIPMGKVLLRNVIRHTDAHNKIQEETEMWKMREWEKQGTHQRLSAATECTRGQMHCDRVSSDSRYHSRGHERNSGSDEREAHYWTRKLYEFEAADPDRWGHSGFKELYPEQFESDREEDRGNKHSSHNKKKGSKSGLEAVAKTSKKCSRKNKKKKKKKKMGKKRKRDETPSSDSSSDDCSATKSRQRRKRTKSKHKQKRSERDGGKEKDSSSDDSDEEGRDKWVHSQKKIKLDFHQGPSLDSRRKERKNYKVGVDDTLQDSSED